MTEVLINKTSCPIIPHLKISTMSSRTKIVIKNTTPKVVISPGSHGSLDVDPTLDHESENDLEVSVNIRFIRNDSSGTWECLWTTSGCHTNKGGKERYGNACYYCRCTMHRHRRASVI
jgi:hypothetical protein